jgi:hypothetical protein
VERLMRQLGLERLALADVTRVEEDAADVRVVDEVREEDLELAGFAVARGERALERQRLLAGGGRRDAACEALAIAGDGQAVEARPHELLGRIAEDARARRALIAHRRVRLQHGDEVARVAHQRSEARLAAAAVHLLLQHGAVERERDLAGQRAQRRLLGLGCRGAAGDDQDRVVGATRVSSTLRTLPCLAGAVTGSPTAAPHASLAAAMRSVPASSARHEASAATRRAGAASARRATATSSISRGRSRATSSAPARSAAASRSSERSCWRTSPAMRTTTRPNRVSDARGRPRSRVAALEVVDELDRGATSDASVSRTRRKRVSATRAGRRLLEPRHRRVQRGRAPEQVEADPAGVEPELVVVGPWSVSSRTRSR